MVEKDLDVRAEEDAEYIKLEVKPKPEKDMVYDLSGTTFYDYGVDPKRPRPQEESEKSEKLFNGKLIVKQRTFMQTRKRIAHTLQNPRLLEISFRTFRHWKATMLYHQTKDPFYVMNFLRHKSILNTQIYVHLEKTLWSGEDDEFHVKVAKTVEEACKLAEVGFNYFTTIDGAQIFRKRK